MEWRGVRAVLEVGRALVPYPPAPRRWDGPAGAQERTQPLAGPHLGHKPSWVTHPVFPINWVPFPDVPNQVGTLPRPPAEPGDEGVGRARFSALI